MKVSLARIVVGLVVALPAIAVFMAGSVWLARVAGLDGEAASSVLCLLLMAAGAAGLFAHRALARSAFHEARLESLGPVQPGGTALLKLSLEPRRPLELVPEQCVVRLVTREHLGDGGGAVERARTVVALPTALLHRHEVRLELPVPPDVPVTRAETKDAAGYETEAQVTLAIQSWPDLALRATVQVVPRQSAGEPSKEPAHGATRGG